MTTIFNSNKGNDSSNQDILSILNRSKHTVSLLEKEYNKIDSINYRFNNYRDSLNKDGLISFLRFVLIGGSLFVGYIASLSYSENDLLKALVFIGILAIGVGAFSIIEKAITNSITKKVQSALEEANLRIDKVNDRISEIYENAYEHLNLVPGQYHTVYLIDYLTHLIKSGKASDFKEAMNLTDRHIHEMTLQLQNQQILENQYQQSQEIKILRQEVENARIAAERAESAANSAAWMAHNRY